MEVNDLLIAFLKEDVSKSLTPIFFITNLVYLKIANNVLLDILSFIFKIRNYIINMVLTLYINLQILTYIGVTLFTSAP